MTEPGQAAPGQTGPGTPLLEVRELTVHHGQLAALREVSLTLRPGDVYAMIGANGAGKSTLLGAIAGLHRPTSGVISLDGKDITGLRPERRVAEGIVLVPEGRRLFPSLTLEENLLVGSSYARKGPWAISRVYELFDWMPDRRRQPAGQLSGGEQQAVAIGRALVANPRLLLLDELSLGLAPALVRRIYDTLPGLIDSGITVLLVEQDVSQALRVATRVHCLLEGRTTLQGEPGELTADTIENAYFGLAGSAVGGPGAAGPGAGGATGAACAEGSPSAGSSGPGGPAGFGASGASGWSG
jgi:branched-chain amino acid transport system ATP-binding protein